MAGLRASGFIISMHCTRLWDFSDLRVRAVMIHHHQSSVLGENFQSAFACGMKNFISISLRRVCFKFSSRKVCCGVKTFLIQSLESGHLFFSVAGRSFGRLCALFVLCCSVRQKFIKVLNGERSAGIKSQVARWKKIDRMIKFSCLAF